MIAKMIARRGVSKAWDAMNKNHIDVDALLKQWADDAVWHGTSDIRSGETIKGKKAIAEWFLRWEKEFPNRKLVTNNICLSGTTVPSPNMVTMVDWTCTETDKTGHEYKYNGATVMRMKNMKIIEAREYIAFAGLPPVSDLLKPEPRT